MEGFNFLSINKILKLPREVGVYCFKGKPFGTAQGKLLYIGKAANIRERVKNHFLQPAYRDNLFINLVSKVGYIKTGSEISALLLEAKLIKKYQPKFNVVWRDDKNYFYVGMTKEAFPQIFITHQTKSLNTKYKIQNTRFAGPFVDGKALKEALKFLRKVFPYRSCRFLPKRACLWHHLDRCPAPCTLRSKIMEVPAVKEKLEKEAQKDAALLFGVISGKRSQVLKNLKQEMKIASENQNFEKAKTIRDKIFSLQKVLLNARIFDQQIFEKPDGWQKTRNILQKIVGAPFDAAQGKQISRIEAYDVSNIQGKEATGSMVVFADGKPDKSQYRKFKIKIAGKPDDTAMLKEILSRRFRHKEWGWPDLILIDGGRAQLNAALGARISFFPSRVGARQGQGKAREKKEIGAPIISLAKRNNELHIEDKAKPLLLKNLPREISNLILNLRDEAHRFAIAYHKKLREVDTFN